MLRFSDIIMTDPFNMVPVLIRPINEISGGQFPLDRDSMDSCWNCGGIIQYVQVTLGLVMFDKDSNPMIMPIEHDFYCAQCGQHSKSWSHADENKDVIIKFDEPSEARDAEFLLSMKENADTYKAWSEDKYKELMKKVEEFKKKRWGENGSKRKRKNT